MFQLQREGSFFPRHVLSIFILAVCIISLLWFQLPSNALSRHLHAPSKNIYDVYIQGSQDQDASGTGDSRLQPGDLDSQRNDTGADGVGLPPPSVDFTTSAIDIPFEIYDPYPDYNSKTWKDEWKGAHFACEGPRGVDVNGNADDMFGAYRLPTDAVEPQPIFGSYKDTGLGFGYCFERHARNSAYGDEDAAGDRLNNRPQPQKVEWEKVNWGRLQRECYNRNRGRFQESKAPLSMFRFPAHEDTSRVNETLILPDPAPNSEHQSNRQWLSNSKRYKARNAVLLRTYENKKYTPDNMLHIRSMITELSLHSGAEYEVFLLVQIVDLDRHIFSDPAVYQKALDDFVPHEFHNVSVLFNVPLLEAWYPKVGKHNPKDSQQAHMTQPVQLFSLLRPDFDMYWQFELDVRYTGHHYHHLEAIRQWSQKQPRKLQWERAGYFYSPFIHRTWKSFSAKVGELTKGSGVWGAVTTTGIAPVGPKPPTESAEEDDFEWGVGEPADMINIMPIVDPVTTYMMFRDVLENYPDGKKTPRRTAPITPVIAMSKRLIRAMHHSQVTLGTHMMPEMFPESSALQHGLKVVAFPEPVYLDISDKGPEELESIFNNLTEASVWNGGGPHRNVGKHANYWWSSGMHPEFSNVLYRRWLGIDMEGNKTDEQRLCLPAITLHPIKGP
ncbi:MAG: hypothetical protein Q9197_004710 [Variospora fuerteventurae]